MRYSTVILALAAAVAAQSGSETVAQAPTPTGAAPVSSEASKITKCLEECDVTDVNCQAKCVDVPSPNDDQANDNIACARECDQGDGSAADTEAFGQCLRRCADQHYFSLGHGTPNPTNGGGSNNDGGDDQAASATGTDSGGGSSEETGSPSEEESGGSEESGDESGSPTSSASGAAQSDDDSGASPLAALTSVSLFGLVAAFFL